jgi:hypothetical protein
MCAYQFLGVLYEEKYECLNVEVMTVTWYQHLNHWTDILRNRHSRVLLKDVGEFQFSANLVYSCNKFRIT